MLENQTGVSKLKIKLFSSDITDGSQQEVQVSINVPSTAEDGSVSRVTITASPNPATGDFVFTSFNIIVRNPSANRVRCVCLKIK